MNNFFKKIGVGAMSLSLVLGMAASNGLVANANSNVKGKSINVSNISKDRLANVRQVLLNINLGSKLNELGNWGNVALAREVFNFKVFGAYSLSLNENEYDRILNDANELNEGKKDNDIKKLKNIENNINGNNDDVKSFDNGKHFFEYIFSKGMKQGIHKVKIGNDLLILFFEKDVEAGKNNIENIDKIISEKGDELKKANIKNIEGRDHLDIFIEGEENVDQSKK